MFVRLRGGDSRQGAARDCRAPLAGTPRERRPASVARPRSRRSPRTRSSPSAAACMKRSASRRSARAGSSRRAPSSFCSRLYCCSSSALMAGGGAVIVIVIGGAAVVKGLMVRGPLPGATGGPHGAAQSARTTSWTSLAPIAPRFWPRSGIGLSVRRRSSWNCPQSRVSALDSSPFHPCPSVDTHTGSDGSQSCGCF